MPEQTVLWCFLEAILCRNIKGDIEGFNLGGMLFCPDLWSNSSSPVTLHATDAADSPFESIDLISELRASCKCWDRVAPNQNPPPLGSRPPTASFSSASDDYCRVDNVDDIDLYNYEVMQWLKKNQHRMRGELHVAVRGKEMVIGIGEVFIRINYGLEGHPFWAPTKDVGEIIHTTPVVINKGNKTKGYMVPDSVWARQPDVSSPQAYVRELKIKCPDSDAAGFDTLSDDLHVYVNPVMIFKTQSDPMREWDPRDDNGCIVFADHNGLTRIHIMLKKPDVKGSRRVKASDLQPGSPIWPFLWTSNRGAVFDENDQLAEKQLDIWRTEWSTSKSELPVLEAIVKDQWAFPGFGRQEATDMLAFACIPSYIPAPLIARITTLFLLLKKWVRRYPLEQRQRISSFFKTMGGTDWPRFREWYHREYLRNVFVYQRKRIELPYEVYELAESLGLFNPSMVLPSGGNIRKTSVRILKKKLKNKRDGLVIGRVNTRSRAALPVPVIEPEPEPNPGVPLTLGGKESKVVLKNYVYSRPRKANGKKSNSKVLYSPYRAKAPDVLRILYECAEFTKDLADPDEKTDIGVASFRTFTQARWAAKKAKFLLLNKFGRRKPKTRRTGWRPKLNTWWKHWNKGEDVRDARKRELLKLKRRAKRNIQARRLAQTTPMAVDPVDVPAAAPTTRSVAKKCKGLLPGQTTLPFSLMRRV